MSSQRPAAGARVARLPGGFARIGGRDVHTFAGAAFLAASGLLHVLTVPLVDQWLAPAFRVSYFALGPLSLLLAVLTWRAPRLRRADTLALIVYGDVAIVAASTSFSSPDFAVAATILLVLPTIFVALFSPLRGLLAQLVVVTIAGTVMLSRAASPPTVVAIQAATIVIGAGGPAIVVLMLRLRLAEAIADVRRLATTDPLTGLLNRRGLDERAARLVGRALAGGAGVGVIVADLDHFKRVNDERGHAVGDEALCAVADAVRGLAGDGALVVRIGGEEIVVVTTGSATELSGLAERIRATVEAVGAPWGVTLSLGVATGTPAPAGDTADGADGADGARDLVRRLTDEADTMMYLAKESGRNQVRAAVAA